MSKGISLRTKTPRRLESLQKSLRICAMAESSGSGSRGYNLMYSMSAEIHSCHNLRLTSVVRLSPSIRGVAMACQMRTEPSTLAVAEAPVGAQRHTAHPVGVPGQRDADRLAGICVPTPAPSGHRRRWRRGAHPGAQAAAEGDAGRRDQTDLGLRAVGQIGAGDHRRAAGRGKRLGGVGGAGQGRLRSKIPALRQALVGGFRV